MGGLMWCPQVKFVSEEVGTGLYQYFIKVIPTNYKGHDGKESPPPPMALLSLLVHQALIRPLPHVVVLLLPGRVIRTNRISVTERFKPLHREGQARLAGDSHAHNDQTSVLPGTTYRPTPQQQMDLLHGMVALLAATASAARNLGTAGPLG